MSVLVLCKKKHRIGGTAKRTKYRSRSGPLCCNANCGSPWRQREAKNKRKYNFGRI